MAARAVTMTVCARQLGLSKTGEKLGGGIFNSQLEQAALAFPEEQSALGMESLPVASNQHRHAAEPWPGVSHAGTEDGPSGCCLPLSLPR